MRTTPSSIEPDPGPSSEVLGSEATEESGFVLDLDSNPHPKMLDGALRARRAARFDPFDDEQRMYWLGYLHAMADATGCERDDIEAWMDRHEGGR